MYCLTFSTIVEKIAQILTKISGDFITQRAANGISNGNVPVPILTMPPGRGKRVGRQAEADAVEVGPLEQPGVIGNAALDLILKKISELEGKLAELRPSANNMQNKDASSSVHAASEVESNGNDGIDRQEAASPASANSILAPSEARNLYVVQPSVSKPSFDGKPFANPIAFLKRLKKYIRAVNGIDREIDIALGCITGHARKVMDLYSKGWVSFADFETDFRRTYWTEQIQESVRYRLINSVYSSDSRMTMSEHFAEQVESMQSLTIAFSERDLVNSIMRHYSLDIQRLWFTRTEVVNIMSGANFLRSMEQNIVEKPRGVARGVVGGVTRGGRYNGSSSSRPITATISASTWRGRGGSARGRGYRRGRLGYGSDYNRTTPYRVERDRASTRPAINFVKEGEESTSSKHVGEGQSKN